MHDFAYVARETLEETLSLLAEHRPGAKLLAGGTSLVPQMRLPGLPEGCSKGMDIRPSLLISLRRMRELSRSWGDAEWVHLGALSTIRSLLDAGDGAVPLLAEVASAFGSPEIRNAATVGGNVCNASPAGSLLVPLLALQAEVRLMSAPGERYLAMADFYRGPHRTALRDDELLAEVRVARGAAEAPFGYSSWSTRPALGMLLAAAACVVRQDPEGGPVLRLACSASTGRPVIIEEGLDTQGDAASAMAAKVLEALGAQEKAMIACHYAQDHPQYPRWYMQRRVDLCVREACSRARRAWSERQGGAS